MSILTTATATLSLPRKAAHRLTSRGRNLIDGSYFIEVIENDLKVGAEKLIVLKP